MPIASVSTRTSPSDSGGSGTLSSRIEFGTPGEIVKARIGRFPKHASRMRNARSIARPYNDTGSIWFDGHALAAGFGRTQPVYRWVNDRQTAAGPYCISTI